MNLKLENEKNPRGRAILFCEKNKTCFTKLFDLNRVGLKESITSEILEGKLLDNDVYEAFYSTISPLENSMSKQEIIHFGQKESRDILEIDPPSEDKNILLEILMEQACTRYATICRESIYMKVVEEYSNEIFSLRKRVANQFYYLPLFQIAHCLCEYSQALKNYDIGTILDCYENLEKINAPIVGTQKIIHALEKMDMHAWQETVIYLDAFFLTLKKHFPFALSQERSFFVNKTSLDWLSQGVQVYYEEYFLSLLREDYEKAEEIKQAIDNWQTSQSLNGCSNL